MEIIWLFIVHIILGLLCSIPGLILNNILQEKGIIRDSKVLIVFGCILGVIAGRIIFPQIPTWIVLIFIGFSSPSGAFRNDLWITSKRGRWWWKAEKELHNLI